MFKKNTFKFRKIKCISWKYYFSTACNNIVSVAWDLQHYYYISIALPTYWIPSEYSRKTRKVGIGITFNNFRYTGDTVVYIMYKISYSCCETLWIPTRGVLRFWDFGSRPNYQKHENNTSNNLCIGLYYSVSSIIISYLLGIPRSLNNWSVSRTVRIRHRPNSKWLRSCQKKSFSA